MVVNMMPKNQIADSSDNYRRFVSKFGKKRYENQGIRGMVPSYFWTVSRQSSRKIQEGETINSMT